MNTRNPKQAKSTEQALQSVFPKSFKLANDKSSNGYKYFNLLFGVELDQADMFLKDVFNNSFITTMDFGETGELYQVYLSGIADQSYLNVAANGIPIKITNNGSPGGEAEFWDGSPTRTDYLGTYDISGVVPTGHIVGLNYFRTSASGYGYFFINTDIDQGEYLNSSGSAWKLQLNTVGDTLSRSGLWPGVFSQNYDATGVDEIITPKGSGFLSNTYPLTRRIRDDSGVYWNIDAYQPYHGWVRGPYDDVVAKVDYPSDYFYDSDGTKCYFRMALNNPYGSGNYTTEYIPLNRIPVSGTLKVYDMDILDLSGNATEIPSTGKTLYKLKSDKFLAGPESGKFDPIYIGYDETVPDTRTFGNIRGETANELTTTSWEYQRAGGYIDDGTKTWVEGSGALTNLIKINNPYSRYIVEYDYKVYDIAKYITSMSSSRYVNYHTTNPLYSNTDSGIFEEVDYEFTHDPNLIDKKAKYITFNGWHFRPGGKIKAIDFSLPVWVASEPIRQGSFPTRETHIGYSNNFVPLYHPSRTNVLNCPFDNIVALGTVTEDDLSSSGNNLEWASDSANTLLRTTMNGQYAKSSRYVSGSGFYYVNDFDFIMDNTYIDIEFRLLNSNNVTLLELSQETNNRYIKIEIKENGKLEITSNGFVIQCNHSFEFDNLPKRLLVNTRADRDYTTDLNYYIYFKEGGFFKKDRTFVKETTATDISSTYLHVLKNCTADIGSLKIWHEAGTWQV